MNKELIARLKAYQLTLNPGLVICDRRAVDEAATRLAEAEEERTSHPLEAYADSYAQMSRQGNGMVDCRSVEVDIRQNMIPVTSPIPAITDEAVERAVQALAKHGIYLSRNNARHAFLAAFEVPK